MGNFLATQWLRHYASTAGGVGSTRGGRTKISHAVWHNQLQLHTQKQKKGLLLKWTILPQSKWLEFYQTATELEE